MKKKKSFDGLGERSLEMRVWPEGAADRECAAAARLSVLVAEVLGPRRAAYHRAVPRRAGTRLFASCLSETTACADEARWDYC